jgi:hypothetical protein
MDIIRNHGAKIILKTGKKMNIFNDIGWFYRLAFQCGKCLEIRQRIFTLPLFLK